jgi:hypothetical protein
MTLDLERIRARQAATMSKGGKFYRPKDVKDLGKGQLNTIRVFSFVHMVTKEDIEKGRYTKDLLGKKVVEFDRPVVQHFGVNGSRRPLRSTPALMKQYEALSASDDPTDQSIATKIAPRTAHIMQVVDTSGNKDRVALYGAPPAVWGGILDAINEAIEEGTIESTDEVFGPSGLDFKIRFDKSLAPAAMYKVSLRTSDKSESLSDSLEEQVRDLYDESVIDEFFGTSDSPKKRKDEDEEEESEEDESEDEDDLDKDESEESEDEDEDSDDEDSEEESDDEDDEEKDEEDAKPKRRGRPSKK